MSPAQGILVVDDQEDFTRGLTRLLRGRFPDCPVQEAFSGPAALELLHTGRFHLMLTDLRMPAMNGLALLAAALAVCPQLSVIMLTAHGSIETAVEALKAGAYDFLTKPVETDALCRVVEKGLERARLKDENTRLRTLLGGRETRLLGESQAMHRLRSAVAAIALSDYTVLVRGESGTGKDLTARLIHDLSPRRDKPFIAVNCPAIPAELLESEMFGHVRGAFTGAERDREGLFAAAEGSTLHLDEIGDIPLSLQTKLLRVLQEREVRPVGSDKSRPVNVRIVASTNQDLEAKIRDKSFREDLYYRLNVLSIEAPPLRERACDIPLLAGHFLALAAAEMGAPSKEVDPEVFQYLSLRPWPGNVRELQNYMRRLAVFCPGLHVDMGAVRLVEGSGKPGAQDIAPGGAPYKTAKEQLLHRFTEDYVCELLTRTGGNISEAGRLSGLSRVALQKMLSRLGLDAEQFRQG
ncbi:sigma-54 dependent transcriptional regulator/response regulator [hydrocarbon metagenome]|uniref:Sigma-54 dependent transcriptional regulator/response regulator n=1 Tax=hydrocarbon metagenome TaxID=938273 RepID=A0A0W8G761_9ZZZZ